MYRADWRCLVEVLGEVRIGRPAPWSLDRLVHGRLDLEPLVVGGAREGRDDLDSLLAAY